MANDKKYHVIHKHSLVTVEGLPKLPTSGSVEYGEIAINYAKSAETISIRNSEDEIVTFSCDDKFNESFRVMSKAMCDLDDRVLALEEISAITVGDVIYTESELENITTSGKVVDALVVKDINDTVSNIETSASTVNARLDGVEASCSTIGDLDDYWANIVLSGNVTEVVEALNYNANYVSNNYIRKPAVIYETDGTSGLLGINASTLSSNWQLENLNLSQYSYLKCYFRASDIAISSNCKFTPSLVVTLPLDDASKAQNIYTGGLSILMPFNNNRHYSVTVAVDSTKTKFQVVSQVELWDVSVSDANNNGRYCYKIEAYL